MVLFEFSPQKNTKRLSLVTGLLIIGAAILMIVTMILGELSYRWSIQLLSLGMLAVGVFITTRYVMRGYVYAVVRNDEGDKDLTVTEVQGRHTVTVCRVGLSHIERVIVIPQGDKQSEIEVKNEIRARKCKQYNYRADLFDEKNICLFVNECGEEICIRLSYGESLEKLFNDCMENATEQEL